MLRVGIYQGGYRDGVEENIRLMEEVIASNVKSQSLDLIGFCELFLSGYCIGEEFQKVATECNSPVIQRICDLAQKYKVALSFGYPERFTHPIY